MAVVDLKHASRRVITAIVECTGDLYVFAGPASGRSAATVPPPAVASQRGEGTRRAPRSQGKHGASPKLNGEPHRRTCVAHLVVVDVVMIEALS